MPGWKFVDITNIKSPHLIFGAAGLFGGRGVMYVAQDAQRAGMHGAHHLRFTIYDLRTGNL